MPRNTINLDDKTSFSLNVDTNADVETFRNSVRGALLTAKNSFKSYIAANATYPRSSLGLWNVHSPDAALRIDTLLEKVSDAKTTSDAMKEVAGFLQSPDGRLNAHSLKTTVLDNLGTLNAGESLAESPYETREKILEGVVLCLQGIEPAARSEAAQKAKPKK